MSCLHPVLAVVLVLCCVKPVSISYAHDTIAAYETPFAKGRIDMQTNCDSCTVAVHGCFGGELVADLSEIPCKLVHHMKNTSWLKHHLLTRCVCPHAPRHQF